MGQELRVASFFCGCGGMDLGIEGGFRFNRKRYARLPFRVVYACDNDPYCTKIYNANLRCKCEVKDVRELDVSQLPEFDILIGGFPCQSFSISAQNPPRLGCKDVRGMLFFEMVRTLKSRQPRFFIAENVKGILSANDRQAFTMILSEFETAGYKVKHTLVNAADFGVPQKRERVIIVGFREKRDYEHFEFPRTVGRKVPLATVIDEEANHDGQWFFSQRAVDGMMRVRDKMNKGRTQNLAQPCNTISSHLAKVSLNSTDPVVKIDDRYRRFTPREAARIQSFPDSFTLDVVSQARQYRAIGNAVPPVMMWHIAKALQNIIEAKDES